MENRETLEGKKTSINRSKENKKKRKLLESEVALGNSGA